MQRFPQETWRSTVPRIWKGKTLGGCRSFGSFLGRQNADKAAAAALVFEADNTGNGGEQGVVFAAADVGAGLVPRAALPYQDRAGLHQLPAEALHAEPLSLRIAAVDRRAAAFFVCHECALEFLEFDVADLHGRVVLPVAAGNLVLLGPAVLENGQLRPASLTDDFAGDRGFRGPCAGDELLFAGVHRENVVERDLRADLARQPLHPHRVARRDAVLFVSTANDGVHCASETSVKLPIINSSSRSVNAFGHKVLPS